jgi:hypothetical protein
MPKFRVQFRDGNSTMVEARDEADARQAGRSWYMGHVRYYGSSMAGHKNEQRARRSYIKAQKPTSVEKV